MAQVRQLCCYIIYNRKPVPELIWLLIQQITMFFISKWLFSLLNGYDFVKIALKKASCNHKQQG